MTAVDNLSISRLRATERRAFAIAASAHLVHDGFHHSVDYRPVMLIGRASLTICGCSRPSAEHRPPARRIDNVANRDGHYRTTGPEIWEQTNGKVDGFTCAVGSGCTLGGVARALKERYPDVKIALNDPMGAALYN